MNINAYALSKLIQPEIGLGGFTLGMSEKDILDIKGYQIDKNFYGETKYIYLSGAIIVTINNETKKAFRISAMKGYYGKLAEKIFVGMPIKELLSDAIYSWTFLEEQGGFECSNLSGIHIATDIEDPTKVEAFMDDRYIGEISVYDKKICI